MEADCRISFTMSKTYDLLAWRDIEVADEKGGFYFYAKTELALIALSVVRLVELVVMTCFALILTPLLLLAGQGSRACEYFVSIGNKIPELRITIFALYHNLFSEAAFLPLVCSAFQFDGSREKIDTDLEGVPKFCLNISKSKDGARYALLSYANILLENSLKNVPNSQKA